MSSKETLSNPLVYQHFRNWAFNHKLPEADSLELETYLKEARTACPECTLDDAINQVKKARQYGERTTGDPFANISSAIDWNAITYEETQKEEVLQSAEVVKSAIEQGLIQPKDVGLYRRPQSSVPFERMTSKARQSFEEQIAGYERRIGDLQAKLRESQFVQAPKFRVGDKVRLSSMEGRITELNYEDSEKHRWNYTFKDDKTGTEYVAKESELSLVPFEVRIQAPTVQPQSEIEIYIHQKAQENSLSEAEERELFNVVSPRRTLEQNRIAVDEEIALVLRQRPMETPKTATEEIGRITPLGKGLVNIETRTFESDTLEARIEHERGYALTPEERAVLKLPLFQTVEKNAKFFSHPEWRGEETRPDGAKYNPARSYPKDLRDLITYYLEAGELKSEQLRAVGLKY